MVLRLLNVAGERGEPPELQQVRLEEALRANVMKAALGCGDCACNRQAVTNAFVTACSQSVRGAAVRSAAVV